MENLLRMGLLAGIVTTSTVLAGPMASNVMINGYWLDTYELAALERQIGMRVMPGVYLADGVCWVNLTTGQQGCLGGAGDVHSRYGSGERNAQGDWSHWSNMAGGGGTADGCVYAFNWSNC